MRHPKRGGLFAASATALIMTAAVMSPAAAAPDPRALAATVQPGKVQRHLQQLQKIAEENGNTRASGTPGYAASREYVVERLKKAGYKPTVQEFQFPFFEEHSTAVLEQLSPDAVVYEPTPPDGGSVGEFVTMEYSGSGPRPTPRPRAARRPTSRASPPEPSPSSSAAPAASTTRR
jgi:hypothetical protein